MQQDNRTIKSSPLVRIGNFALWAVAVAVLAITVFYSWNQRKDVSYWDGAIGNLAATLIGVIVGIPIGLQIDHWRQGQEDRKQRLERKARAREVAILVKDELLENLQRLEEIVSHTEGYHRYTSVVRDDIWRAMSDSGEIRWLDDSKVLGEMAIAYFFLGIVHRLNDDAYKTARGFNPAYAPGSNDATAMIRELRQYIPGVVTRLTTTVELITKTYELTSE